MLCTFFLGRTLPRRRRLDAEIPLQDAKLTAVKRTSLIARFERIRDLRQRWQFAAARRARDPRERSKAAKSLHSGEFRVLEPFLRDVCRSRTGYAIIPSCMLNS